MVTPSIKNRTLLTLLCFAFALITIATVFAAVLIPSYVVEHLNRTDIKFILVLFIEVLILFYLSLVYVRTYPFSPIEAARHLIRSCEKIIWIGISSPWLALGVQNVTLADDRIIFTVSDASTITVEVLRFGLPAFFLSVASFHLVNKYGDDWVRRKL